MPAACADGWWCWLSWPGWAGVGGVVALLALAAALALGILALASARPSPRMFHFEFTHLEQRPDDTHYAILSFSAIGPEPLYEVDFTLFQRGLEPVPLYATTPVMRVGDQPFKVSMTITGFLADTWIVVDWWEPHPRDPVMGGARFNLVVGDHTLYVWRRWRFPVWPRKFSGRWVKPRDATTRNGIDQRPPKARRS